MYLCEFCWQIHRISNLEVTWSHLWPWPFSAWRRGETIYFSSSLPFLSKSPLFKETLRDLSLPSSLLYLSCHLSLHPSHRAFRISLVPTLHVAYYEVVTFGVAQVPWEGWREGYRRDIGGEENISPILFPLCIKAFPKIMGEMRPKSSLRVVEISDCAPFAILA